MVLRRDMPMPGYIILYIQEITSITDSGRKESIDASGRERMAQTKVRDLLRE